MNEAPMAINAMDMRYLIVTNLVIVTLLFIVFTVVSSEPFITNNSLGILDTVQILRMEIVRPGFTASTELSPTHGEVGIGPMKGGKDA